MTMYLHHLNGCSPTPLALYLKAIGILRLVSEQVDPTARGWWQDEHFCLLTTLDRKGLETFFLEKYSPTPFLSPWNAGSGFYKTWDKKNGRLRNSKNVDALEKLLTDHPERTRHLTKAVEEIRHVLSAFYKKVDVSALPDKERGQLLILPVGNGPVFPVIPKNDEGKLQVQRALIRFSRSTCFYRSAMVELERKIDYPSLWGSGGNDSAIDYTGRFFENLGIIFKRGDESQVGHFLTNALFDSLASGMKSKASGKVGQFLPSGAGGPNCQTGPGSQNDTHLNPWDFILMLEGAVVFSARATRRLDHLTATKGSAPFSVHAHAAGHASAGDEKNTRGEQWMPIWKQPTTLNDLTALMGDGRMQLGRQSANRPMDAARAVARLGVTRGISEFTRYGFLERNGQSTLAVPLGRINVVHRPHSSLIDDIAPWMERVQRLSRETSNNHPPARLIQAERRLANAVFEALTHDRTPDRWQAILTAAVEIETIQASGTALKAGPIPGLQPGWIAATFENTSEFRLALALGSAAQGFPKGRRPIDPVRHHWLPLEPGAYRFQISDKRLMNDPRVVITGRDAVADCAAIVQRRLIDSQQASQRTLPLKAAFHCDASLQDIAHLLLGHIDLHRVLTLARALMAIRWQDWDYEKHLPSTSTSDDGSNDKTKDDRPLPDDAWLAIRLACLPKWKESSSNDQLSITAEPAMVPRLLAGDGASAVRIATRRLGAHGIRVPFQSAITDPITARLWAAALAFPISRSTVKYAINILVPGYYGEEK